MNRRSILVGLGTIVAGGGAALGSGAFSQVQAERSAEIQTSGDAAAFLAIEAHPDRSDDSVDPNNPDNDTDGTPYLSLTADKTLEFYFDGSGTNAAGLNQEGLTKFDNLLQITNNGSTSIDLDVTLLNSDSGGGAEANENGSFDAYEMSNNITLDGSYTLDAEGTIDVGFRFDLRDGSTDSSAFNDVSVIEFKASGTSQ